MTMMQQIKEIRFWRGRDKNGRPGWHCSLDVEPFHTGTIGKGWGCCRPIAFVRAKRDLRRKLREARR